MRCLIRIDLIDCRRIALVLTLVTWLHFRLSPRREICGIDVRMTLLAESAVRELGFSKIEKALRLIRDSAPVRFAQVRLDIDRIWVLGARFYSGRYIRGLQMCELYYYFVLSPATTPAILASTIVHEAQHARHYRLGFVWEEQTMERLERLCYRASRNFLARVSGGTDATDAINGRLKCGVRLTLTPRSGLRIRLRAIQRLLPTQLARVARRCSIYRYLRKQRSKR